MLHITYKLTIIKNKGENITMINTISQLPLLLKRKHFVKDFGISDTLYYSLVKHNLLPVVRIKNRIYVNRDEFLSMLNEKSIDAYFEKPYDLFSEEYVK